MLVVLPSRTDDSVGRIKADLREAENLVNYLRAKEYNALADAVVAVCQQVGLGDGTTPGSIEKRIRELGDAFALIREEAEARVFEVGPREAALAPGDAACILPSGVFGKADPLQRSRMPAVGVVESIDGPTARIQTGLVLRERFAGLTPGKIHRVGRNGKPTADPVVVSSGEEFIDQGIGMAVSSSDLLISPASFLQVWKG